MGDIAQRLLNGPRGRQLAVLAAIGVERRHSPATSLETVGPLANAYFYAEVGQAGVSYFGWGDQSEVVATEAGDLVAALESVPLESLNVDALPEHLAEVVDSAKYWQEPDRIDVLLSRPDVVQCLRPWAEQLSCLDETSWWSSPADLSRQFVVNGPQSEPWETPVHRRLIEWREDERQGELDAMRERPADARASWSGWWWSGPPAQGTTRGWPTRPLRGETLATSLLEDATFDREEAVWGAVELPASARVLEITCAEDWARLCREHPIDVSASRRHDWYRCTGRVGQWVIPDWSQIAQVWDAVHLPVTSYLELAGRPLHVDDSRASVIAGWSPDMTYWLTTTPEM